LERKVRLSPMTRQKIIAVVGMPGSGKAIVSKVASTRGIPVLVCGDIVREATKRRGLAPTPENTGKVMLAIRQEEGPAVVAERLIPKIASSAAPILVVEGVRGMAEVEALRRNHTVVIVAVHSSPKTRYERLIARGRSDDPKSPEEFADRDARELGVGIGDVIALAQEMLINETSFEELNAASEAVFSRVIQG
jgi:dephospho-CoA kinase